MGVNISDIGSTLVEQLVGFSSEKIYPNNFVSVKITGEGDFGRNENDGYGGCVAISENYAVIGVPKQSYSYDGKDMELSAGAAYIYERDANTWVFKQKITEPVRSTNNQFGFSVAVDQDTIVIGSPSTNGNGSAYVYQYSETGFELTGTLTPTLHTNIASSVYSFGNSVSITNDMIIVGSPGNSFDNSETNTLSSSGAAWVYVLDSKTLTWNQVQKLAEDGDVRNPGDMLGFSMEYSNGTLAVGAPWHSYEDIGRNYQLNAGAVFVWSWDDVTNTWTYDQKITPKVRSSGNFFGSKIAIDQNTMVVLCSDNTNTTVGYSTINGRLIEFTKVNGKWIEGQSITPTIGSYSTKSTIQRYSNMTYSNTEISLYGDILVFSITDFYTDGGGPNSGIVNIMRKTNSWNVEKILCPGLTAFTFYGFSLSAGKDIVVIGNPYFSADENGTNNLANAGMAQVYEYQNSDWVETQKIVGWGQDRNVNDGLGSKIYYQDGFMFVSATGHSYDRNSENYLSDSGAVYVWQQSGNSWVYSDKLVSSSRETNELFGSSISGTTGTIVIGAMGSTLDSQGTNKLTGAGAVYIFQENNGVWSFSQKITSSLRASGDNFGTTVSMNGTSLMIGSPNTSSVSGTTTLSSTGVVEFYEYNGSWKFMSRVSPNNLSANDKFGTSVSLNSGIAVVGSPTHSLDSDDLHPLTNSGAAWIYQQNSDKTWSLMEKISGWGQDRNVNDMMGYSIAGDGDTIVVGVPNHSYDVQGRNYLANSGAALVFIWYNGGWFFQQKLIAGTNRNANDNFGFAVDISQDNIVVGAPQSGQYGRSYVFNRSYGVWSQAQEINYIPYRSDYYSNYIRGYSSGNWSAQSLFSFGASVSLDKNLMVIGFPWGYSQGQENSRGGNPGGYPFYNKGAGTAFAYSNINGTWVLESEINSFQTNLAGWSGDNFGISVSVKDGIAVCGSPLQSYDSSDTDSKTNAGAAYVFERTANGSNFIWNFSQKLAGGTSDRYPNDQFGSQMAIDNKTIVVSSLNHPYDEDSLNYISGEGAVYVWVIDDSGQLNFQQKVTAQGLNARNTNSHFGSSIDLRGDLMIVGSPYLTHDKNPVVPTQTNYGGAFIFLRTNGKWAQQGWISPPVNNNGSYQDATSTLFNPSLYGSSVSIIDENTIVIGAPNYKNSKGNVTGAIFLYGFDSVNYEWVLKNAYESPFTDNSQFGYSMDYRNGILVVGSPNTGFTSYSNNTISGTNIGSASIYRYSDSSLDLINNISSPNTIPSCNFGYSMDIYGETLVIGSPSYPSPLDNTAGAGAALIYKWNGSNWSYQDIIYNPTPVLNENFGYSVATNGDEVLVGNNKSNTAGAAYLFSINKTETKTKRVSLPINQDLEWTVPQITNGKIKVHLWGGAGSSTSNQPGGSGSYVSVILDVKEGDILKASIGGAASGNTGGISSQGYNGGNGLVSSGLSSMAGGAASCLLLNSSIVAIAAGGGGASNSSSSSTPGSIEGASLFFQDGSKGQDADNITMFAAGGGGYRGGMASSISATNNSGYSGGSAGLSWFDKTKVESGFIFKENYNGITSNYMSGSLIPGYDGVAGTSTRGSTSHDGMIIFEYMVEETVNKYSLETNLIPLNIQVNDNFGYSVSLSKDLAVVGAPYNDSDSQNLNPLTNSGSAFVFEKVDGSWNQTSKLTGGGLNGRNANDRFGLSVSCDNGFIIVGAPYHGYDRDGYNYLSNNGAAWVFEKINGTWQILNKITEFGNDITTSDVFGSSIACDGSTLFVGAPGNSYDATLDDSGTASYLNWNYMSGSGSVYIWEWDTVSTSWIFKQKITASDRAFNAAFGSSIAYDGKTFVANAPGNSGAVYLFEKNGTYPTAWNQTDKITGDSEQLFGRSVDIDEQVISIPSIANPQMPTENHYSLPLNGYGLYYGYNYPMSKPLGAGDFTLEFIVKSTSYQNLGSGMVIAASGNTTIMNLNNSTNQKPAWQLTHNISYNTPFSIWIQGTSYSFGSINTTFNSKMNIAMVRKNGVLSLYVNGIKTPLDIQNTTDFSDTTGIRMSTNLGNNVVYKPFDVKCSSSALYDNNFVPNMVNLEPGNGDIVDVSYTFNSSVSILTKNGDSWDRQDIKELDYDSTSSFGNTTCVNKEHGLIIVGAKTDDLDETRSDPTNGAGSCALYQRDTNGVWSRDKIITDGSQDSTGNVGWDIDVDQNMMVISSTNHCFDKNGTNFVYLAGAVWIWRYDTSKTSWVIEQKITPSIRLPMDNFGYKVSLSGNTLAVSATGRNQNSGVVYIFNRPASTPIGTLNSWKETTMINPTSYQPGDMFGYDLKIQESTESLIASSPYHIYDKNEENPISEAGAVWSFVLGDTGWVQNDKLVPDNFPSGSGKYNSRIQNGNFGISVALKDNTMIVGMPGDNVDQNGFNVLTNSGSAFLYVRTDNKNSWIATTKLVGRNTGINNNDNYGTHLAYSNGTLAIGSPGNSYDGNNDFYLANSGSIYFWNYTNGVWSYSSKISAQDGVLSEDSLRQSGDKFGSYFDFKDDTLVVGLPTKNNAGGVLVYKNVNGSWTNKGGLITSNDIVSGDLFGSSISLDKLDDTVSFAIGSPNNTQNSIQSGSVYVFKETVDTFTQIAKINPQGINSVANGDKFGTSVNLLNGSLIVGAPNHSTDDTGMRPVTNAGAVWLFDYNGIMFQQVTKLVDTGVDRQSTDKFAASYDVSDSYIVVGAPGQSTDEISRNYLSNAGAVYIFDSKNNFIKKLTPNQENRHAGDNFGSTVKIIGYKLYVAAKNYSMDATGTLTTNSGVVFVFDMNNNFAQTDMIFEFGQNSNTNNDNFGNTISGDGNTIVISSLNHPYDSKGQNSVSGAGAVWVYEYTDSYQPITKVTPTGNNARNPNDNFGFSIDYSQDTKLLIVSSINHAYNSFGQNPITNSGAAWVFEIDIEGKSFQQIRKLVQTGDELTTNENFGSTMLYDGTDLVVRDQSPTDKFYENYIEGTGSLQIFSPQTSRTGIILNGSSYMDVSPICDSISGEFSISLWFKSTDDNPYNKSLFSVRHGLDVLSGEFDVMNNLNIFYQNITIIGKTFLYSPFDGDWHNLIVSGINSSDTSKIAMYLDGNKCLITLSELPRSIPENVIADYRLDGNLYDYVSGIQMTSSSIFDNCELRDGMSCLEIPRASLSSPITDDFSISFWFKLTSSYNSVGYTTIMSQLVSSDGTVNGTKFLINVSINNKGNLSFRYGDNEIITNTTVSLNTWYNIVVSCDTTNKIMNLYLNDIKVSGSITSLYSSNQDILIGTVGTVMVNDIETSIPNNNDCQGNITGLKIYKKPLGDSDITLLYGEFKETPVVPSTLPTVSYTSGEFYFGRGFDKNFQIGKMFEGYLGETTVVSGEITSDQVSKISQSNNSSINNGSLGNWLS